MRARAIMVVGTSSGVGKSWLCTGLCRLIRRRGLRVAPFKAINFSSQTAPAFGAEDGLPGEIGRAQAVQAEAAGLEPHVDMNPVLVRSRGPGDDDVLLLGRPEGEWRPAWRARRDLLWTTVSAAYDRLADRNDVVVIEGAGSPAELNLRGRDIANMHTAHHAKAAVLLLGDNERGGVFASLFGTLSLLSEPDRALVAGLVINRASEPLQLASGVQQLAAMTGVPVRGVIPYRPDVLIEHGDSLIFEEPVRPVRIGRVDLCAVLRPGHAEPSFLPWLGDAPGMSLRRMRGSAELGNPDGLFFAERLESEAFAAWAQESGLGRGLEAALAREVPTVQPTADGQAWEVSPALAQDLAAVGVEGPLRLERAADRRALVNSLRRRRGLDPIEDAVGAMPAALRQGQYDALADLLEQCLDLDDLLPPR